MSTGGQAHRPGGGVHAHLWGSQPGLHRHRQATVYDSYIITQDEAQTATTRRASSPRG